MIDALSIDALSSQIPTEDCQTPSGDCQTVCRLFADCQTLWRLSYSLETAIDSLERGRDSMETATSYYHSIMRLPTETTNRDILETVRK